MSFYKFEIVNQYGVVLYSDCGYETETDAEIAAQKAIDNAGNDWNHEGEIQIVITQLWQELSYETPTQILFFEPEGQQEDVGIACGKDVISLTDGKRYDLGMVEVRSEKDGWINCGNGLYGLLRIQDPEKEKTHRYEVGFVDGHDNRYKLYEVDADTMEEAKLLTYMEFGRNFEHRVVSLKEIAKEHAKAGPCEDCAYHWADDGEEYSRCHWESRCPGDKAPCEE